MIIILDNGHGENTLGKCSPDKSLREYAYTREITSRLKTALQQAGYAVELIVTEKYDVSLSERCRRVNTLCKKYGAKNCVCVSVHNNAAANTGWNKARGFSVFVSNNASENSKRLAKIFTKNAKEAGLMGNRSIPSVGYWQQNLAMCRDTNCPAVLTENLFQDNIDDVKFLLSEAGKLAIVNLHLKSLIEYIKG